jgi:hypothetical protein
MVTHRWWGDKFCKRTCKNAYLRENHHTLSGWFIPRFFTFAGGACLAAVVAVALLTLLLASANAAPGEECQYPARRSGSTRNLDSAGGQVEEGDRVLAVLNEIKYCTSSSPWCPTASCARPCAYRSPSKARTVLRRGRVSGSSTRPPNGRQTVSSEPTSRRRGGCPQMLLSMVSWLRPAGSGDNDCMLLQRVQRS